MTWNYLAKMFIVSAICPHVYHNLARNREKWVEARKYTVIGDAYCPANTHGDVRSVWFHHLQASRYPLTCKTVPVASKNLFRSSSFGILMYGEYLGRELLCGDSSVCEVSSKC